MRDQFSQFGDIFKASIYGASAYVSRDPQHAQHVLRKNWQNYRKGLAIKRIDLLLGKGLMVSEGDFWKRQRRLIQPAFHKDVIAGMRDIIVTANAALLNDWERAARNKESINITHDISVMVLDAVLMCIFGEDYGQIAPHFRILSDKSARDLQFAHAFRSLGKLVIQVAAQRREKDVVASDLLAMLMAARDPQNGEAMSDRQLVNEIMTLIVAGHETTASSLNWIWYLLSENPEAAERLSRELADFDSEDPRLDQLPRLTHTRRVIEEALRLYPPGWLMTRRALKDDRLGEYFVPAGTEIYVPPYFIQRHPDLWEAPDRFDPDRFDPDRSKDRHPLAMLPFAAGPRNCIGEPLARLEMQIHLVMIAKKLRLRYERKTPPEMESGVNLRARHDFIMTPEIRELPISSFA